MADPFRSALAAPLRRRVPERNRLLFMRATLSYTVLRLAIFLAAILVLYLVGARGILLLGIAALVSAIASYVLLIRQREAMAGHISRRFSGVSRRVSDIGSRLDDGAKAEDID
jgi:hypothetical protein